MDQETDTAIADEVTDAANAFCAALNKAGKVGLNIEVGFYPAMTITRGSRVERTGWHSTTRLSRIIDL